MTKDTLDTAQIIAWVAATQDMALPAVTASLMLKEMEPALARALTALEHYGIEGEPADFRATLKARAEQQP